MKPIFLLILFISIVLGCNQPNSTHKTNIKPNKSIEKQLIQTNFLKYAPIQEKVRLEKEIMKLFNIYDDSIYKFATIDAEELTEFSFDFFMPKINKILSKRNIQFSVKKLNQLESSNDILINSDTIQLYTANELNNNSYLESGPKNFFRKLNQLIKLKAIKEQFYLMYSGNDFSVILLTKNEFQLIKSYFQNDVSNSPYLP
jgi:hypothetical protein